MIDFIHRHIDRTKRPTYIYERAAFLLVEVALLVACAVPVVTSVRAAALAILVGALRLHEAELRREDASVTGRHAERGGVSPLPAAKEAQAQRRARALELVSWAWPSLTTVLLAADQRTPAAAWMVAVLAALVRAAWARLVMPAWRRSRVAWRTARDTIGTCAGCGQPILKDCGAIVFLPGDHLAHDGHEPRRS